MIHYAVSDFVGPINKEQRDALDRVLAPGERILWATRPKVSIWPSSLDKHLWGVSVVPVIMLTLYFLLSAYALFAYLPLYFRLIADVIRCDEGWTDVLVRLPVFAIIFLAFWLSGRFCAKHFTGSFLLRRYRRHTIYVITNKQALTVQPGVNGWETNGFSLDEDMVIERRDCRAGGELIFRQDMRTLRMEGWTALGDREEAERQLRAAWRARGASEE